MGRRSQLENDYFQELLSIGPFGGVDPTTNPYYVAPANFVDAVNIVPNQQYGGYVTVPGRLEALTALLPSAPRGIGCLQRAGQPDTYLFACDQAGQGTLWAGQIGGVPTKLNTPAALTAGQLTFFAASRKWVFITNGVDTPIKVDTNLLVTYWGIEAPTVALTGTTSGTGPLNGEYYYCETLGNADQESGQGVILGPISCAGVAASGTFTLGGAVTAGDKLTAVVEGIPITVTAAAGQQLSDLAIALAGGINQNAALATLVVAKANGNDVIVTSLFSGSGGNLLTFYGVVSSGATETLSPANSTDFSGGEDGNSITITPHSTTTDPQVTTRNLYRIGGSSGQWMLVHSQGIADMTPYLDVTADADLTGQSLVVFRDPPPVWKSIATYQDRIFGFGTSTDPTLVGWSNYNEPYAFNLDSNTQEAGPNDLGDIAVTCGDMGSMLLLLKTRSAYAVIGNSDTTFTVISLFKVGCTSAQSLAIGDNIASWLSKRGPQLFDASQRLDIGKGRYQQSNVKAILDSYNDYDRSQCVGFYYDFMHCFSFPTQNTTLCYDRDSGQWFPLNFALGAAYYDPEATVPLIGSNLSTAGQIDQWFASTTQGDLGNPITAHITSRITDTNTPHADKQFVYAYVEAPVQPGAFCNLYLYVNPGIDQILETQRINLGDGALRHRWEIAQGVEGTEAQIKVQTVALAQTVLHRIVLFGRTVRVHKPNVQEVNDVGSTV